MASLASLGCQRYVSQNALAAILDEVKKSGIPKATSRSSIKRSREMQLEEMTNEFGHWISYIDFEQCSPKGETAKGTVKLPFINPLAFSNTSCLTALHFKDITSSTCLALVKTLIHHWKSLFTMVRLALATNYGMMQLARCKLYIGL